MGAFIVAAIVFVLTCVVCFIAGFANMMSDAPTSRGEPVLPIFVTGTVIAAVIAFSHYMPHIGW
jgi:hypothetical protein